MVSTMTRMLHIYYEWIVVMLTHLSIYYWKNVSGYSELYVLLEVQHQVTPAIPFDLASMQERQEENKN